MKQILSRKISLLVVIALTASTIFFSISSFAGSTPKVTATSTVVGYGATFTVSGFDPDREITYLVDAPGGQRFTLRGFTKHDGSAVYHLDDRYVQSAGVYQVQVVDLAAGISSDSASFQMFVDTISPDRSQVSVSKSVVFTGSYDFATVDVLLLDTLGNPIRDHFVSIISDRNEDRIKPVKPGVQATDTRGSISFAITSPKTGIANYTVYDMTSQTPVGTPFIINYVSRPASSLYQASLLTAVGGEAGPAYSLSFEQLSPSVQVNQPVDFTITAYDTQSIVATGYTGTVHFTALGDNGVYASLPKDYTYTASDLGTHTFPLSLQFQQEGVYQLEVRDIAKPTLSGTTVVVVKGGVTTAPKNGVVTIVAPSPGSYSTNIQSISGIAPAGKDVKIFDGAEEVGTSVSNLKGEFEFATQPLADGPHEFSAVVVDQKGAVLGSSQKVSVMIDTSPPKVENVQLLPGYTVTIGELIQIQMNSEQHLKKLVLDLEGVLTELMEDQTEPGVYRGSFVAPETAGDYSLKFVMTDALNNETTFTHPTFLTVGGSASGTLKAVGQVNALPEMYKVTLSWSDAANPVGSVKQYRIYYGSSPTQLSQYADTKGPVKSWYIPNLQNGITYYFGVVAVDMSGNLGAGGTLVVATPNDPKNLKAGLPAADTLLDTPGVQGETGPEVFWLVPLSIGAYRFVRLGRFARKLRKE